MKLSDDPVLIELLARLAHDQWSGWLDYMLERWDATHPNGETFQQRWIRQASTAYASLPPEERESDRVEARRVTALIDAYLAEGR